jgi:hypothetical protein
MSINDRKIDQYLYDHRGIFLIVCFYAVFVFIISPFFECCLDDDWAYARGVKNLLDTGKLELSDWCAATSVFPTYWGGFFSLLFGFSFSILRISTLILSLIGAIAFYLLLKEFGLKENRCILGTLCLVLNPIYFFLSYTFMTDVPYISLMLLSALFYLKGIRRDNNLWLFMGSILATCSFLTRQLGIFIPVALLVYLIISKKFTRKGAFAIAVIPLLCLVLYGIWFTFLGGATWVQLNDAIGLSLKFLFRFKFFWIELLRRLFATVAYLGLFVLPLLIGYFHALLWPGLKKVMGGKIIILIWTMLVIAGVVLNLLFGSNPIMPYFCGVFLEDWDQVLPIQIFFTICASVAAILLGSVLTIQARELFIDRRVKSPLFFLLLLCLLQLGTSLFYYTFFDEYLLVFLPFVVLFIFKILDHNLNLAFRPSMVIIPLILMGTYAMIFTQEFHNFKQMTWSEGYRLVAQKVPLRDIDIEFEWNGWFRFENEMGKFKSMQNSIDSNELAGWEDKFLYTNVARYKISDTQESGYRILKDLSSQGPLLPIMREVYLLERIEK